MIFTGVFHFDNPTAVKRYGAVLAWKSTSIAKVGRGKVTMLGPRIERT